MIIYRLRYFSDETELELKKKLKRGCDKISKPAVVISSNIKRRAKGLSQKRTVSELRNLVTQKQNFSNKLYKASTNPIKTAGNVGGSLIETVGREPLKGIGTGAVMFASKGTAPTALTTAVVDKVIDSNPVTKTINNTFKKGSEYFHLPQLMDKVKPQENFSKAGELIDRPIKKGVKWILKRW